MNSLERRLKERRARLKDRRLRKSGDRQKELIGRIAELTRSAKGIWFVLLGYMGFVGIALMGVEDADFFLTDRETTLPLVNVPVPTFVFMAVAPTLGALLYSYFHIHLMKLWEALAAIEPVSDGDVVSDIIAPWLVNDLALSRRADGAIRERPLKSLADFVVILLTFVGTPALLFAFWYRSAVPHLDWLTPVVCGIPVCLSVLFGVVSWTHMTRLAGIPHIQSKPPSCRGWLVYGVLVVAFTLIGWFRVEGTLDQYARKFGISEKMIKTAVWSGTPFPRLISRAHLYNVNFAGVPADWRDPEQDREAFRPLWCSTTGLPPDACGSVSVPGRTPLPALALARTRWCESVINADETDCLQHFADFEKVFWGDWQRQWNLKILRLKQPRLSGVDLRFANLSGAHMQGADLGFAMMQGANLWGAQLQGTILRSAQMQDVDLSWAQIQGAKLLGAQLQGAKLFRAQMQGADLDGVQMQGANLRETRMDATNFRGANLRGAALREIDFSEVLISQVQIDQVFGDDTVLLPPTINPPDWFRKHYDSYDDFEAAWREWQRSIGFDPDDPSTWDG